MGKDSQIGEGRRMYADDGCDRGAGFGFETGAGADADRLDVGCDCGDAADAAAAGLIGFISKCPTMFHAADQMLSRLERDGFERLREGDTWEIRLGGRYVVTRNGSSILAFKVGERCADPESGGLRFQIAAAHTDSPAFKLKSNSEAEGPEGYLRLDTEAYGGMIDRTWFDRPLSIAGRVMLRVGTDPMRIVSRLVDIERPVALIPSLAVHLDHETNSKFSPNRNVDLRPIVSAGELGAGSLDEAIAEMLGVQNDAIVSRDLFVYNCQPGVVWGIAGEFLSAPRIDDLACAYASAEAFATADNPTCVTVLACFDNEEVGSRTKQGAMSTFMRDVLGRVAFALSGRESAAHDHDLSAVLSRSILVSCDNAHAVHPNHPEKHDELNRARLNGGIVVKEAASQRYCTDAFSRAVFCTICDRAGLPHQVFANRSDMPGGSTLGNLLNIQASVHAVDVGIPQLAMHSAFETMGTRDVSLAIGTLKAFFEADIRIDGADSVEIL